jgi:hypothetical protein
MIDVDARRIGLDSGTFFMDMLKNGRARAIRFRSVYRRRPR